MALTSRELASIVVFVALVALVMGPSPSRRDIARSFVAVLRAVSSWKILAALALFLAWAALVVLVAYQVGAWSIDVAKDTVIVIVFVGLPLVFAAVRFQGGADVIRRVAKEVLGISALLVVYLNLAVLPLWGELVLQVVMLTLALLAVVAARHSRNARLATGLNIVMSLIGALLVIFVAVQVLQHFGEYDWGTQVEPFVLSIWLPIALIPFVYWFGFFVASEAALVRIRSHSSDRPTPRRVRLALILGFHGSLGYAARFKFHWIFLMAKETSFPQALHTMREYRRAVRTNLRAEQRRQERLKALAGIAGRDENGLWLDRREFHDTKDVLTTLSFSQMGWYRNRLHRYQSDPDRVVPSVTRTDIPKDHGIQLQVSKDGKAWVGWRQTIGGYYFAVGGTKRIDEEQWQYDGDEPPAGCPARGSPGWRNVTIDEGSAEWAETDGPIPDV